MICTADGRRFCLVLALDFDGTLHDDPSDRSGPPNPFEHVPQFEAVLRSADPEGRMAIVISSDWRLHETLAELKAHFSADIAARIVGVTPSLPMPPVAWGGRDTTGQRQDEIETWIHTHAPKTPWIALDDRAEGFRKPYHRLVLVPPHAEDGRGLDEFSLRALSWAIRDGLAASHTPEPAAPEGPAPRA